MDILAYLLLIFTLGMIGGGLWTAFECIREKEHRAPKVALSGAFGLCLLIPLIIWVPFVRTPLAVVYGLLTLFGLSLFIPGKPSRIAVEGAMGHAAGSKDDVTPQDERDQVFARNRLPQKGSEIYDGYYKRHPEWEEIDANRREKGGPLGIPGRIDGGYRVNVSRIEASFAIPDFMGPFAKLEPVDQQAKMDPAEATHMLKSYTKHLGADLVGVCKINPNWVYSHRGEIHYDNWEDWGKPIENMPPYAVVFVLEMDHEHVSAGPHTPCASESANLYAKGAYIGTILACWLRNMGYQGVAQHTRNYDMLMVPLAVDAGLGELGRQGYLLSPKFGARGRIFAVLTDMPLVTDKPISIGAEEFCQKCKKCAESCPSNSIPMGDKTVYHGILKWKLNAETCFDYWAKVGTDCSICMGICPFSRPNTLLHKIIRYFVANSPVAKAVFPIMDNFLYGKKWKPKKVSPWMDYPRHADENRRIYDPDDVRALG